MTYEACAFAPRGRCADADVIITTALIPNRPAPILVQKETVMAMRRGSVIVDLAAENGGNVESTTKGKVITTPNGVTVIGYTNLASRLPSTASALFGNNVAKFLLSVGPTTGGAKGEYKIDYVDDAVRGMHFNLLHAVQLARLCVCGDTTGKCGFREKMEHFPVSTPLKLVNR